MSEHEPSLVEKRERYIRRMIELKRGLDVQFEGLSPSGSGCSNRHGMPQVPVGQHRSKKWPVLDLGVHPEIGRDEWELEITGLVEQPVRLDWEAFMALPQVTESSDFHCVTSWSCLDYAFGGVHFKDLASLVVPKPEARFILTTGYDVDPGSGEPYTTNLSLDRALDPDVMLVHTWNDQPLPREHGGPVRMITPRLYAWKGAKWIRRIEFTAEEQLGFWERRGYSNTAEPWYDDRFSSDEVPPGY
ncbi:MAG: DMSO/TMAO reductase YedYZ molybdopterin-dependent catalytic subunit [Planctomycetota bacterium]|jgi:DMSO/TMAO reductase YedYZ molybdopterin-dependent catalytic subunit